MTQTQNAPKLRFPGFEGDWTRRKFDKIFKIRAGGDIDDSHTSKIKTEKFPFPIYANAKKNFGLYGYSDIYRVNEDCVTVAGRGVNIGYTVARCEPFYPIVRLLVLVPKSASDVHFFQSAIERTNIFVESTGVPQLTGPQLSSYQLAFPTLPEQRKIAGFLGAVDEKIAQLSRKKALLEDYKKGCMQQLFSQKIRFKDDDGNDFPDWEEKRLGELAKVTTGSSNRKDSDNVGEYAFFDRSNDVRWSSRYLFDCKAIIVAGEGKDFPPRFFNGKFDLHQRAYAVTDFGVNSARFLFFWINQHRAHFLKFSVGSTMPSLRMSAFANFPVSLPHPTEQRKIADFLSALDTKIDLVGQELTHARSFKAGLLQQMFV